MNIKGDDVEIKFDDSLLQKFFDINYTQDMINLAISFKDKFKFKSSFKTNLKLSNYDFNRISEIIIPQKIDEILKQKYRLFFTKGNYISSNSYVITSPDSIDKFDDTIEFIMLDMHDSIYAFVPGTFDFNNNLFKTITIPLVLKDWQGQEFRWKETLGRVIRFISGILFMVGYISLVFAFADPVRVKSEKVYTSRGTDILFVLDNCFRLLAYHK